MFRGWRVGHNSEIFGSGMKESRETLNLHALHILSTVVTVFAYQECLTEQLVR